MLKGIAGLFQTQQTINIFCSSIFNNLMTTLLIYLESPVCRDTLYCFLRQFYRNSAKQLIHLVRSNFLIDIIKKNRPRIRQTHSLFIVIIIIICLQPSGETIVKFGK